MRRLLLIECTSIVPELWYESFELQHVLQATFDSEFNNIKFASMLRPRAHVLDSEQRRQDAIEERNALMQLSMNGAIAEPIVQHLDEEVESIDIPETPVEMLTEDCQMLRDGVEKLTTHLVSSLTAVRCGLFTRNTSFDFC